MEVVIILRGSPPFHTPIQVGQDRIKELGSGLLPRAVVYETYRIRASMYTTMNETITYCGKLVNPESAVDIDS